MVKKTSNSLAMLSYHMFIIPQSVCIPFKCKQPYYRYVTKWKHYRCFRILCAAKTANFHLSCKQFRLQWSSNSSCRNFNFDLYRTHVEHSHRHNVHNKNGLLKWPLVTSKWPLAQSGRSPSTVLGSSHSSYVHTLCLVLQVDVQTSARYHVVPALTVAASAVSTQDKHALQPLLPQSLHETNTGTL